MASSGATGDALFAGLTVRVDLQGQMMQQQIVKGKICKLGGKIAKEGERADVVCLSDSATASDAAAAALLGAQVLKRKWVEDSVRDNKLADRAPYLLGADPAPSTLGKRASDGPAGAGAAARESGGGAEAKKPRVDAFSHMMGASKNKALDLNSNGWFHDTSKEYLSWWSEGFTPKPKVAAYDMDGTIITVKSGARFPKDADDWCLLSQQKPDVLKKKFEDLAEEGYAIVLISNQKGVGNKKDEARTKAIKELQRKVSRARSVLCSIREQRNPQTRPGNVGARARRLRSRRPPHLRRGRS
ncbi:polynucleotide kinase 3 phosphatase-domain-containing protein [Baffinella frigidus]|nr:polynucleotide kinase 3 phosphatase-domain-containing protein [Cryptophyta sp. CCMP2293]